MNTPPSPDLRARYEFGREIARGGMGRIWEAKDLWLGREVAVKVMLTDDELPSDRDRFLREAAVLAKLAHPNIVPIHDIGYDDEGTPFYAMKLVRGRTLEEILKGLCYAEDATLRDYGLDRLLTIFRKVCDAVSFAHSEGIIHRDLKPENIMVGEFGEVQVMDWGLAKDRNDSFVYQLAAPGTQRSAPAGSTLHGEIMGSPRYMAPEQAQGRIADQNESTDVFALGGILYSILTLRPPIGGATVKEALAKAARATILSPTAYGTMRRRSGSKRPRVVSPLKDIGAPLRHCPGGRAPKALSAVAMKALSANSWDRHPSAAALAADVEAYQNGFATSAEKAGPFRQIGLFVARHRTFVISLTLLLTVGGVFGTRAILEGIRAERALTALRRTAPALRALAQSEATFQRFDSAMEKLDAALGLAPNDPEGWWQRAWLFVAMQRWTEAAEALRVAQAKDPANASRGAIAPTLEAMAKEPEETRWSKDRIDTLIDFLETTPDTTPAQLALASKLQLQAEPRRKLVADRLKEWLGPGYESRAAIVNRSRVRANLDRLSVDTLELLRGLPLDELNVSNSTRISSLEPLRGMRLRVVEMGGTKVADLSPLLGMPLESLAINETDVTDLTVLRGTLLKRFWGRQLKIPDVSPLRGVPLQFVDLAGCNLRSIDFLTESPVETLILDGNYISDLSPLRGKPLKSLEMTGSNPVRDFSPLRGTPIENLRIDGIQLEDFTPMLAMPKLERIKVGVPLLRLLPLRKHPKLKYIAQYQFGPMRPVAEVWKELETQAIAAGTTLDDYERNLDLLKKRLSPLAGVGTTRIAIRADSFGDITLDLRDLPIQDLEVLRGLQIHRLILTNTAVANLEPLRGMGLKTLDLTGTRVRDLSPLDNAPITELIAIGGVPLDSVEPILRLPKLERLRILEDAATLAPLRRHPSLRMLSAEIAPAPYRPAADFWRELDKGAAQPK